MGTGWTGLTAAREILDFGFGVVLVPGDESGEGREGPRSLDRTPSVDEDALNQARAEIRSREDARFLPEAKLTGCRGEPGNFTLHLESGEQVFEESAAAVVLACELRSAPLLERYGLTRARNAVSLSGLEQMLASGTGENPGVPLPEQGKQIAFLFGFAQEGDPLNQRRILTSLRTLDEMGSGTCVYARNLKVADDGLVELAKTDRQLGTVIFKLDKAPDVSPDGSRIRHTDPVLEREVRVHPDLIVVEEQFLPGPANERLARVLNVIPNKDGFLQEENIHRLPVHTNRRGVFSVGTARGILSPEQIRSDAANAALVLHDEFRALRENVFQSRAFIDEDKCCVCLTCYRLCPHGAVSLEDKPVISSAACQGCGLCASQCPQEAISVLDTGLDAIEPSQAEDSPGSKDLAHVPGIIAFCCRNSAYDAGMAAYAFNRELPSGLDIVDVPCAGSITREQILNSLENGADGLLLLGCHSGACKSTRGTDYARYQSERLGAILEEVGLSRERIRFRTLAENMDADFAAYTRKMEKDLVQLGPNPLNGMSHGEPVSASERTST